MIVSPMAERVTLRGQLIGDDGALLFAQGRSDNPESLVLSTSDGRRVRLGNIRRAKKHGTAELDGRDTFALYAGDLVLVHGTLVEGTHSDRELRVKTIAMPGFELDGSPIGPPPDKRSEPRRTSSRQPRETPSADAPRREVRVLVGRARAIARADKAPEVLFANVTMTVGESKTTETADVGAFELHAEDGARYRIEGLESARVSGSVSLAGPYGDLVNAPLAKLFARHAPGDHVEVEITGRAICDGDSLTVEAELLPDVRFDGAPSSAADFRTAPAAAIVVAKALHITLAGDARAVPSDRAPALAAPKPTTRAAPVARVHFPLETSTRVYLALGALALGGSIAAGTVLSMKPDRAALVPLSSMGAGLLLVGLNRWLRATRHASFVTIAGRDERKTELSAVWGYRVDAVFLGIYAFGAAITWLEPAPRYVANLALALVALSVLHAIFLALQERAFRRFASRMLSTAAADPRSGKTVFIEGTARGSDEPVDRRVEFFTNTEVTYSTREDGSEREHRSNVVTDRQITHGRPFELETSKGSIVVDPHRAQVAFASRRWIEHTIVAAYDEALREGAPVCLVARCSADGESLSARAGGDESMFLWAGTRGDLVKALWGARARVALLVGLALIPAALGLSLVPYAARYRATGTVTSTTLTGVSAGDRCVLRVLAYYYRRAPRCTVTLDCGRARLYGGYGMGQMDCVIPSSPRSTMLVGEDSSRFDGDDALRFDLRALSVTHESAGNGEVTRITLDSASPVLALH